MEEEKEQEEEEQEEVSVGLSGRCSPLGSPDPTTPISQATRRIGRGQQTVTTAGPNQSHKEDPGQRQLPTVPHQH